MTDVERLLQAADESYKTLVATVVQREDPGLWRKTLERLARADAHAAEDVATRDVDAVMEFAKTRMPEDKALVRKIWSAPPERLRIEYDDEVEVWSESETRIYHPGFAVDVRPHPPNVRPPFTMRLAPQTLVEHFDLKATGRTTVAGRHVIAVRATPRDGAPLSLRKADEYELAVDAERGVVLRFAALIDGEVASATEVVEIAFDEHLPPSTFEVHPAPGEQTRVLWPRKQRELSAADAAAAVPFPLFLASRGWRARVLVPDEAEPTYLHVDLTREDGAEVELSESAEHDEDLEWLRSFRRWNRTERDGIEFRYLGGRAWPSVVELVRDGTELHLTSTSLDAHALIDLAASLERVG